jgi:hypothetical protein
MCSHTPVSRRRAYHRCIKDRGSSRTLLAALSKNTKVRNRGIHIDVIVKCVRSGKVSRVADPTGEFSIIKIQVSPSLNKVDEYRAFRSKAVLPDGRHGTPAPSSSRGLSPC